MTTKQHKATSYLKVSFIALFMGLGIAFFPSCTKTSDVGGDIFDQDISRLKVDSLLLPALTVSEDSVRTFDLAGQATQYLLGKIDNPDYGTITADINMQFLPKTSVNDFKSIKIVDVNMYVRFGVLKTKIPGDIYKDQGVEVYRMSDQLVSTKNYYSNSNIKYANLLGTGTTFIGTSKIWPNAYNVDLPQPIKIVMDTTFGRELLSYKDTVFKTNSLFQEAFRGVVIKPAAGNTCMMSMDLGAQLSVLGDNERTRIEVRYKKYNNDTTINVMNFYAFSSTQSPCVKANNFKYTPSAKVKNLVNNAKAADDYLMLTAPIGPNIKVKLPDLTAYKDKIISKAEIEFTVAKDQISEPFKTHLPVQIVIDSTNNGIEDYILDVRYGGTQSFKAFGGQPIVSKDANGNEIIKYKFNISNLVQKAVKAPYSKFTEFFLALDLKSEAAGQVVFYGLKHPQYAPKIKIVYSDLK